MLSKRLKRNEARKNFTKDGKKLLFCMAHIKDIYPDNCKEANGHYDYLFKVFIPSQEKPDEDGTLREIKQQIKPP